MSDETENKIGDEAAFLAALGVDPGRVEANSVKVQFAGGQAYVTFAAVHPVSTLALGRAFLAASAQQEADTEGEKEEDSDSTTAPKTAARKRPPRGASRE